MCERNPTLSGKLKDPKTLHKYLYAGGDPMNALDPTGHEILIEFAKSVAIAAVFVPTVICGVGDVVNDAVKLVAKQDSFPAPILTPCSVVGDLAFIAALLSGGVVPAW
jgi:hypothetical protein